MTGSCRDVSIDLTWLLCTPFGLACIFLSLCLLFRNSALLRRHLRRPSHSESPVREPSAAPNQACAHSALQFFAMPLIQRTYCYRKCNMWQCCCRGLNRTIMEVPVAVHARKFVHSWQPWSEYSYYSSPSYACILVLTHSAAGCLLSQNPASDPPSASYQRLTCYSPAAP